MMDSMRSFASGIVSKVLMLFLVVSFGIWGIGDIVRSNGSGGYAARVGNETVTIGDFMRQKALVTRQMEAMGAQANSPMFNAAVLRQLVQQKLIVLTMADLGLYVNEALLMKTLRAEPVFQNPDGSFNSKNFRSMMQAQHLNESDALKQIKQEASGKFLIASLDVSDVVPPAPVRNLVDMAALETRDAWIVSIAPLSAPGKIEDADLIEYYEKNKSMLYMQPETRTIDYITLKAAQLDTLVDQSVTDQMVEDAAKSQPKAGKAELRTQLRNEQRDKVMREVQNTIDDALAGGATLADALKQAHLNTAPHTLTNAVSTLAKTSSDDVTKTVAEQGFQLSEGETSGVVTTKLGTPVILHVAAVHPSTAQAFEAVSGDVREHVVEKLRKDATRARVQEVKEALNQLAGSEPKQWQSVLDRFNLTATRVTGLKRPTAGKAMENNIPASLREAVFEHPVGGVAGPLSLESGGQMLAIVTGIHHPSLPAVVEKNTPERQKHTQELSDALNQTVQGRAFTSFAERHRVRVNNEVLAAGTNPADDQP